MVCACMLWAGSGWRSSAPVQSCFAVSAVRQSRTLQPRLPAPASAPCSHHVLPLRLCFNQVPGPTGPVTREELTRLQVSALQAATGSLFVCARTRSPHVDARSNTTSAATQPPQHVSSPTHQFSLIISHSLPHCLIPPVTGTCPNIHSVFAAPFMCAREQESMSVTTDMNERVISQNILLQAELESLMRLNVELRNEKALLATQLQKKM